VQTNKCNQTNTNKIKTNANKLSANAKLIQRNANKQPAKKRTNQANYLATVVRFRFSSNKKYFSVFLPSALIGL